MSPLSIALFTAVSLPALAQDPNGDGASGARLESTEIEFLLDADDADIDLDDPDLLAPSRENTILLGDRRIADLDAPSLSAGRRLRKGMGPFGAIAGSAVGTAAGALACVAISSKWDEGVGMIALPVFTVAGAAAGAWIGDRQGLGWTLMGAAGGLAVGLPVMGAGTLAVVAGLWGGNPALAIGGAAVVAGTWIAAPALGAWAMHSGRPGRTGRGIRVSPLVVAGSDGIVPGAAIGATL